MDELINFFMDPLRLTLIIAGVAVLLAIIIFSRKSSKRNEYVYSTPSSKEFSFGAKGGRAVSDALARDTLVDEEVIVLPSRKQAKQQVGQQLGGQQQVGQQQGGQQQTGQKESEDSAEILSEPSFNGRSHANAYNVKTEPKRSPVNEFSAFQATGSQGTNMDEKLSSDVFDDDVISPARPVSESQVQAKEEKPLNAEPQFSHIEAPEVKVETNTEIVAEEKMAALAAKNESIKAASAAAKEMFVVLHVIAIEGEPFNGLDILEATKTQGMAFGKHAIFHYPMSAAPAGDSKFCLVNMSATGNFESSKLSSVETNGISLIMRLPIRGADALTVFANMVGVSQALARKLGGEILDQTRSPLTPTIIENLRVDIEHFESVTNHAASKKSTSDFTARETVPEI